MSNHSNLVPGATFHPDDADLESLVRRALGDLKLRVVKLHCSVGNFAVEDPRLEPLWRVAADEGVPVLVHAGREMPGIAAAHEVERLEAVVSAHPNLKFVLAHSGLPATDVTVALMRRYANLYGDLTPVWQQPVPVEPAVLAELKGRFLFGSDAPNCPTPAEELAARFDTMGLPPDVHASVMGGAAAALVS